MLIDPIGTEYRSGRVALPKDWIFRPRAPQWWEPQGDITRYKIVARGIGRAILWRGVFDDLAKALRFWCSLHDIGPAPHEWDLPTPSWFPGLLIPGVTYEFATVTQFTSIGTTTFNGPAGVLKTDYLVIAAGGGGGGTQSGTGAVGGGAGAGGMKTGSNYPLTPGAGYTVVIPSAGPGGVSTANGSAGNNSQFDAVACHGGGYGGAGSATGASNGGGSGGSGGGGGGYGGGSSGPGGSGTSGEGNNGTLASAGGLGGGGGGKGGAPGSGNANGGAGLASSITGTSVTYATGGSATTASGLGNTPATKAANSGNGGDGGYGANGGTGGTGFVCLSYLAVFVIRTPGRQYLRR